MRKDASTGRNSHHRSEEDLVGNDDHARRLDLVQKQHGGKAGFKYVDAPQGTRVEVDMPLMYVN
ncbi:MAG: hypothetical protein IPG10_20725 [Flavobacteriales bacterium]|nr:hypothetical protein [Flavobacteriales bacterium]